MGEQRPNDPPQAGESVATGEFRVLVVDDHPVVCTAVARVLDEHSEITVVGQASDGQQVLDMLAARSADVVVMDAAMPHVDGAQATRAIRSRWPEVTVVAISTDYSPIAAQMIAAGAAAFVPKDAEPTAISHAVVAAAAKSRSKH
ncbi:MAG: response regulator transcription factor [Halofilum sp. (in: g-proteobacteria)]